MVLLRDTSLTLTFREWPKKVTCTSTSAALMNSHLTVTVHEPPVPTTKLVAGTQGVPLACMYCEDDNVAALLLALHKLKPAARERKVGEFMGQFRASGAALFRSLRTQNRPVAYWPACPASFSPGHANGVILFYGVSFALLSKFHCGFPSICSQRVFYLSFFDCSILYS